MKKNIVLLMVFLITASFCAADTVLDELVTAVSEDITDEQLNELTNRYKGVVIIGEGIVSNVDTEGFTVYVTLIVSDRASVGIEVPENSTYLNIAKDLKTKQKVSFAGEFSGIDIIDKTIFIKRNISIIPE